VCKFYQGAEDKAFERLLKKMFDRVHREKPESSRSVSRLSMPLPSRSHSVKISFVLQESREAFFVALRRKGEVTLADLEGQ
jgi:21S rRNA (uridine2791-2'-O)-methyltransferase